MAATVQTIPKAPSRERRLGGASGRKRRALRLDARPADGRQHLRPPGHGEGESGNDISKTAEKLDVDAGDYSEERVTAAIDAAKRKAQDDTVEKAKTVRATPWDPRWTA